MLFLLRFYFNLSINITAHLNPNTQGKFEVEIGDTDMQTIATTTTTLPTYLGRQQ